MDKDKTDKIITDSAKTIFLYCRARTNSKEEAEDLSQDILYELLKTNGSFCNEKAFYGFMWVVAGNIYKNWCKKRKKITFNELDENISDNSIPFTELLEKQLDIMLLHRELALLTEQYRKVIIQYYFDDCKVLDISKSLNISESMVKFLLFKSRKILKEGMDMERTMGDLSFNPRKMNISVLIPKPESDSIDLRYSIRNLINGNLLAQNILFTCYNDRCTAEEISLQIGIAVPYLENDLKNLCAKKLLINKGGKYETDIVIFTKEFSEETITKTSPVHREIAKIIDNYLNENLDNIKSIGFYRGCDDDNLLKWHMMQILLHDSGMKYADSLNYVFPTKYTGTETVVFGIEHYPSDIGGMGNIEKSNVNGDRITIHDFKILNTMDCIYFDRYQNRVNIILDIARGKNSGFSENDMVEIAEFIKLGFIVKHGDDLNLKFPVFTKEQFNAIKVLINDITDIVADKMREAVKIATEILVQHTPVSMKKDAENIGWIQARECGFSSVKIMLDNGLLHRVSDNSHPTVYVVLS